MKDVKVLGTGCKNCRTTIRLIEERVEALGADAQVSKVEDIADIVRYGVMSTPGVVVDGVVVHAGGVPTTTAIDEWLR